MKKFRLLISLSVLLITLISNTKVTNSQVIDTFSDGDFTTSPTWSGNTSDWRILTNSTISTGATNSFTLGLDAQIAASGIKYLSTQRTLDWGTEQSWSFWVGRRAQAATTSNQSIVWLYSSEADLTSATVDGYRIIFGDNSGGDNIILQSVTNGTPTDIITSSDTVTNGIKDFGFMVRVTRTTSSLWTLYTSTLPTTSGSGAIATDVPSKANVTISQGSVTNSDYTIFSNGYFGFMAVHSSTPSARIGAEFDQFNFDVSATAPLPVELISFTAIPHKNSVQLNWQTATEVNNYGFQVQRKNENGKRWNDIGFVPGHGNSNFPIDYSFVDKNPLGGTSFYYRLKQIDINGKFEYSDALLVKLNVPDKAELMQNSPNPFNPSTSIKFFVPNISDVTIKIYDILGREVTTLINKQIQAGFHIVFWNGRDKFGNQASSGVYLYRLTATSKAGNFIETKKMTLLK